MAGREWEFAGEPDGPLGAEVHGLAVIGGALWVAAEGGLWSRREGRWQRHPRAEGGRPPAVRALAPAAAPGRLWLAYADGVVLRDVERGAEGARHTPLNSGLAGYRVRALVESAGKLWVVTECGVSRLDLRETEAHP
jgi:ligand-binding sensor domain-containing protein